MDKRVRTAHGLAGVVDLPPDKSIAHRAALFSAIADGTSQIANFPTSADPQSTLSCLRQLGVEIDQGEGPLRIAGRGLRGLQEPTEPIDCGNSGTTMRLLSGILAGQPFNSVLVGDESLSLRPMERIHEPLAKMGAVITLTDGHAPISIKGNQTLRGITYRLPVASAQVKSCVLLAGLYATGETTVIETAPSRDHTERMLGMNVLQMGDERHLTVREGQRIVPGTWAVPSDFSAAAFFLVAGSIVPQGELELRGVGLNPSRSALLDVLRTMGANIAASNEREHGFEPLVDLRVRPAKLHGVTIDGSLIPNLIDEIPVLAVAATRAEGRTEIRGASELRVKETDRIAAMVQNLRALGAEVEEFPDGLAIEGPVRLGGDAVDSFGDHRVAMAMGIAGLVAEGTTTIQDAGVASVSFPEFWEVLAGLQ